MADDHCVEGEEELLSPQPPLCLPDTGSSVPKLAILLSEAEHPSTAHNQAYICCSPNRPLEGHAPIPP